VGSDYSSGLIVNLHGYTDTAKDEEITTGDQKCDLESGSFCTFSEMALSKKFMVVYPQGKDDAWNAGPGCCASSNNIDDTCFVKHVVESIKSSHAGIKNVFATGFSNGGCMDWRLACELPVGYLTAIAPFHGVWGGSTHYECSANPEKHGMNSTVSDEGATFKCPDDRAVPTLAWTGDKDSVQTWIEVYASADRFRGMFSKSLKNYPQAPQVTFVHKNANNARSLECTSTATSDGAGNVTVCINRDPTGYCDFSPAASHRYPDDTYPEDSHGSSMALEFFLSQMKLKDVSKDVKGVVIV